MGLFFREIYDLIEQRDYWAIYKYSGDINCNKDFGKDLRQITPLIYAIKYQYYEIVELLLWKGAYPNCYSIHKNEKITALEYAFLSHTIVPDWTQIQDSFDSVIKQYALVWLLIKRGANKEEMNHNTTCYPAYIKIIEHLEKLYNDGCKVYSEVEGTTFAK